MLILLKTKQFSWLCLKANYVYAHVRSLCQLRLGAMFVRSLWKLEIAGCLYTFAMCILLCVSRWALVHICEDREQLGLTSCLFQSSRPVLHQGWCMLLWRKLLGFSILVSSCLKYTTKLTQWWITQGERSMFSFFLKGRGVKALDVLLLWQLGCFSTSLTGSVCVYYNNLIFKVSGERESQNSQSWVLPWCVDTTTRVPHLNPYIHPVFRH